ncbi:PEP/pyruvate-binding domain-containing protein [Salipaludibacillus daqingensis]|uniref:PEP/pyruvate-binding domain-containing protein n=1 Tax=Salipaludibacillus daqingensis TaxID=3041001 RepID=UPI002476616E|nr:PEP/pyruvate-binding domain-containing protein [Salipaludibacillus daqingensis]
MGYEYVRFLKEIGGKDFQSVGGKAANLGDMLEAQLPVPEGFVVLTDAYKLFIKENNLEEKIRKILDATVGNDIELIEKAASEIQNFIKEGVIPHQINHEIKAAFNLSGAQEVAVRSSATAEDLPGTSFAGQYDTFLNVKGEDELFHSIQACWASLWNSRAISYRLEQRIENTELAHGVVVQRMVNAEKSGILFTANPVNGRRDQILINSSWGLGEAIVSGEVTPDQWVVDKKTGEILEELIGRKQLMTVRKVKGIDTVKIPDEKQNVATLTHQEVKELLKLSVLAENYFGSPQDLEWAYRDERFYLVQSRPITSLYPLPEKQSGKDGLRIHLNLNNYSQAMKEPFTPMGEDIIRVMVLDTARVFGAENRKGSDLDLWWYQVVGGRIFIDITDFLRKEKSWDKFRKNDTADKDPMTTKALLQLAERNKADLINHKEAVNLLRFINLRLVKYLTGAGLKYSRGIFSPKAARNKAIHIAKETVKEFKEETDKLKTPEEIFRFIRQNSHKLIQNCGNLLFYVAVSSTYIEKAKKILGNRLDDLSDLYEVEKSVPYSVTTQMGIEILKLAEQYDQKGKKPDPADEEMTSFLKKYGHRSSVELDVGVSEWREEPEYVIDLINAYIDNQNYQEGINKFFEGEKEAEAAIERIKTNLRQKGYKKDARKVEKLLRDFREMFGIRELSKFVITEVFSNYRDKLIEVGTHLEEEGKLTDKLDIFFVTIDDILSEEDLRQLAAENKEKYHRELKMNAPRLLTSTGESIYSAFQESSDNSLVGVAVSPGIYEGKVKVLETPEEGRKLDKGDILVTAGTNPSWTPLFLKIGALIMETGGPISHGSVVAREYGVPAVAGVGHARLVLKDGQIVKVNGETGVVELVEQE